MTYVNFGLLQQELPALRDKFNSYPTFRFLVIEDFLLPEVAEALLADYPTPASPIWKSITYIHQRNKLQSAKISQEFSKVFEELNGEEMRQFLSTLTGINNLKADDELFGAGFHQSLKGAFLDIHVDFNVHPEKDWHRRLNLLLFLNKNWKPEYGGNLELWDMDKRERIAEIVPKFNCGVIFETTEKSFHGHPQPLNTPEGVTRKSLAVYYYTQQPPDEQQKVEAHNSVFKNTEGIKGSIKNFLSGLIAFTERVRGKR
ncbi:MAG: 2OG-Fe(II) oxygenase [Chitinophagales bacterium]|nr:2OG-Fe(II) oxygenase [Chitinophagales bacterium]